MPSWLSHDAKEKQTNKQNQISKALSQEPGELYSKTLYEPEVKEILQKPQTGIESIQALNGLRSSAVTLYAS